MLAKRYSANSALVSLRRFCSFFQYLILETTHCSDECRWQLPVPHVRSFRKEDRYCLHGKRVVTATTDDYSKVIDVLLAAGTDVNAQVGTSLTFNHSIVEFS